VCSGIAQRFSGRAMKRIRGWLGNIEVTVELAVNIQLRCGRDGLASQRRPKAGEAPAVG
jgi:hypothetical protein